MKQLVLLSLLLCLLLGGCATYPPCSRQPGLYSATTGQLLLADSLPVIYNGWPDYRVMLFDRKSCTDTYRLPVLGKPFAEEARGLPYPAGAVWVDNAKVWIDEAEISNQEWRQYELHQEAGGTPSLALAPDAAAQPVPDYYTNRFYNYYPVVGISYEQAQAFCRWRSQVVTALFNQKNHLTLVDSLNPAYIRCSYRLPTEREWENAAALQSGLPFGTNCTSLPLQIAPDAAAYLRQQSGSTKSTDEIRADITAYNKTRPTRNPINYAQEGPYFIHSLTPSYVYQRPINYYGLYQMLGNAAELVQEQGLTKGGSYRDELADCSIKARGRYNGPAPHIGFRAAATISKPNQPTAQ